jgi:hypothetical protein
MTQLELFPGLPVRTLCPAPHPPIRDLRGQPPAVNVRTSLAAADAIRPCADVLRQKVLAYITEQGSHGATDEEVQDALGMGGNTQRPRRRELFQSGKIMLKPEMRPTRSGRQANVWVIT